MQTVALIDYGSGNLHSAAKAFERAARDCPEETHGLDCSEKESASGTNENVLGQAQERVTP